MAGGILIKGPLLVMFVALARITVSILDRSARWLKPTRPLAGVVWLLLLVRPWFVAISAQSGFLLFQDAVGHAMLGTLNDEDHYQVGLINAALGNFAATAAEADTIAQHDPHHLFVPLLRWQVANHGNDAAGTRRAYRQFLDDYDKEMASGKAEYKAHKTQLEAFHEEATGAVGKTGG